ELQTADAVPIQDRRHQYPHASRLRNVRLATGEYFGGIRAQNGKPFGLTRYRDWRLRSCAAAPVYFLDGKMDGPRRYRDRARAGSRRTEFAHREDKFRVFEMPR